MSAPQKPEPGKAVATTAESADALEQSLFQNAKTFEEKQLAFSLASKVRQTQMVRQVAAALAETGWGKEISPVARAAVARYCLEIGADPVRHVFILGGNVYLNAEFWRDLVAANPKFLRPDVDFIHDDKRADGNERERRKGLRVKYGVPEEALGAAIVTLIYQGERGPFIGVNWAGARQNDPVGKAEPTKTAESRAYRKAAMKAEPAWFRTHPRLAAAEEILTQGRELERNAEEPERGVVVPGVGVITAGGGGGVAQAEPPMSTEAVGAASDTDPYTGQTVMTRHNPNALCPTEGDHPLSGCGIARKSGGAGGPR